MYSVYLSGNGGIFDKKLGFESLFEAKKWAYEHGGSFKISISDDSTGEDVVDCCQTRKGTHERYDGDSWEWVSFFTAEEREKMGLPPINKKPLSGESRKKNTLKKLEKSLRHELAFYSKQLRRGKRYVTANAVGTFKSGDGKRIMAVCADIDKTLRIVTNVTIYCHGDAMERKHHDGDCIRLTAQVEDLLDGELTWDEMVAEMLGIIEQETKNEN